MYKKSDSLKVLAAGLAAAVIVSLPAHKSVGACEAVKGCLLFPQFAEAASSEKDGFTGGDDEIIYSFRIAEIWNDLVKRFGK